MTVATRQPTPAPDPSVTLRAAYVEKSAFPNVYPSYVSPSSGSNGLSGNSGSASARTASSASRAFPKELSHSASTKRLVQAPPQVTNPPSAPRKKKSPTFTPPVPYVRAAASSSDTILIGNGSARSAVLALQKKEAVAQKKPVNAANATVGALFVNVTAPPVTGGTPLATSHLKKKTNSPPPPLDPLPSNTLLASRVGSAAGTLSSGGQPASKKDWDSAEARIKMRGLVRYDSEPRSKEEHSTLVVVGRGSPPSSNGIPINRARKDSNEKRQSPPSGNSPDESRIVREPSPAPVGTPPKDINLPSEVRVLPPATTNVMSSAPSERVLSAVNVLGATNLGTGSVLATHGNASKPGMLAVSIKQKAEEVAAAANAKMKQALDEVKENENYIAQNFGLIRKNDAARDFFINSLPIGGNLHSHIQGELYFKAWLDIAKKYGLYFDPTGEHDKEPYSKLKKFYFIKDGEKVPKGMIPAQDIEKHEKLHDELRASMSMSGCTDASKKRDHFFNLFKISNSIMIALKAKGISEGVELSEYLIPQIENILDQGQVYQELMIELAPTEPLPEHIVKLIIEKRFQEAIQAIEKEGLLDRYVKEKHAVLLECVELTNIALSKKNLMSSPKVGATKESESESIVSDANELMTRFQVEIMRNVDVSTFFYQVAAAMKLSIAHPELVVAFNVDGPECNALSINNFDMEINQIIPFLRDHFTAILPETGVRVPPNIVLHAGEATTNSKYFQPKDIRDHIYQSVCAKVKRVGHALSLEYEKHAKSVNSEEYTKIEPRLFKLMKEYKVAVEILFTSNFMTLDQDMKTHAAHRYIVEKIPLVLAPDDSGVFATNLRAQIKLFVEHFEEVGYVLLKNTIRNSLEYSCLSGESIFDVKDNVYSFREEFRGCQIPGWKPNAAAAAILKDSSKAKRQIVLEQQFTRFEAEEARQLRAKFAALTTQNKALTSSQLAAALILASNNGEPRSPSPVAEAQGTPEGGRRPT